MCSWIPASRGRPHTFGEGAGLGCGARSLDGLPVPRKQLGDVPCRMIGDAGEDVGEVVLRVNAVELGGLDQRIHRVQGGRHRKHRTSVGQRARM
jgi:hypothetical protein